MGILMPSHKATYKPDPDPEREKKYAETLREMSFIRKLLLRDVAFLQLLSNSATCLLPRLVRMRMIAKVIGL